MSKIANLLKSNLFIYFLAIVMLIIMAFLLIKNAREDSATTDEPIHILSGYEYWQKTFTVNPEHPPLGKQLAAIPLEFIVKPILPTDSKYTLAINDFYYDSWEETRSYAQSWLYNTSGNNADQIVFNARIVVIIATLLFGIILFFIAKKWFGKTAAIIALFLYVFSPVILTHGHLVNTDLWMTIGFFSAIFSFAWYLEKRSISRMIISAIIFSIALLLKFSAVFLIPVFVLLWIVEYHTTNNKKEYSLNNFINTTIVFLIISILFIWADYGFPIGDAPKYILEIGHDYTNKPLQILAPILQNIPMPIYSKGLIMVFSSGLSNRSAFILGHFFNAGVWYYFPIAYLVKEPLSLLILLFGGKIYLLTRKRKLEFCEWLIIIPPVFYLIVSLFSKLNIGIRHLMPIYPFIFIFIGYFISEFFATYKNISKSLRLIAYSLLALLFVWYLCVNISIYPYYMTYFNELAGGSKGGSNILSDSNIDWGQDTKRLVNWLKEQNIKEPIKMEYFWSGFLQPKYYGINFVQLKQNDPTQKGWIAIGSSALQSPEFNWLKKYQPVNIIGNSVYVYYIN